MAPSKSASKSIPFCQYGCVMKNGKRASHKLNRCSIFRQQMIQGMQPELQGYPLFVLSCLLLAEIESAQQRLAEEQIRQPEAILVPPAAGAFPSESTASGPAEPRETADAADGSPPPVSSSPHQERFESALHRKSPASSDQEPPNVPSSSLTLPPPISPPSQLTNSAVSNPGQVIGNGEIGGNEENEMDDNSDDDEEEEDENEEEDEDEEMTEDVLFFPEELEDHPDFSFDKDKRRVYFNKQKAKLFRNLAELDRKTGCYGLIYLRR
jgi:hypothetical protein